MSPSTAEDGIRLRSRPVSTPPKVLFGDGMPCRFAPSVLEELGALVVYAGKAGRGYGDDQSLERRKLEADEKAASMRADLQRMLRDGQTALAGGAQLPAWPELREHARKASSDLQVLIERMQEQTKADAERSRKTLTGYQRDIAESMRADLFDYLRTCLHPGDDATVARRLGPDRYVDTVRFRAASKVRVQLEIDPSRCEPPQRIRSLLKKALLQAGTRKALFGREKPRRLRLDPYYVVEAVLSPAAIDLRLALKLEATPDVLLLRLRPDGERIHGQLTMGPSAGQQQREEAEGDDTLQQLWNVFQQQRLHATAQPGRVTKVELDGQPVSDTKDCFACAERIVQRWRPIVTELSRHTPGPDELCIIVANDEGLDDELWVRTADLTQHLLTIPLTARARLAPQELLGPAQVTRESDIIDLGTVMTPDAGDDSDVISLHYIPPSPSAQVADAGAPSPVFDLSSRDISDLDLGRDPQENSGCYDLARLGRSARSG